MSRAITLNPLRHSTSESLPVPLPNSSTSPSSAYCWISSIHSISQRSSFTMGHPTPSLGGALSCVPLSDEGVNDNSHLSDPKAALIFPADANPLLQSYAIDAHCHEFLRHQLSHYRVLLRSRHHDDPSSFQSLLFHTGEASISFLPLCTHESRTPVETPV